MIISPQYKIGFQNRFKDKKLAFVTLKPEYKNFQNWIDKKYPVIDYLNVPKKGFKLYGVTQRSSDYFGDGRNMIYIEHPDGWVFEIGVYNLIQITAYFNIVNQEIDGECILSFSGQSIVLLPLGSEEYIKALKDTEVFNSCINPKDVQVGDLIQMKNGSKYIYIGEYKKGGCLKDQECINYKLTHKIIKVQISASSKSSHYFVHCYSESPKNPLGYFSYHPYSLERISSIIKKEFCKMEDIQKAIDSDPALIFVNEFTIEKFDGTGDVKRVGKNKYEITNNSNHIKGKFLFKSPGMADKKIEI